ncbi:MAG: branched-chain amino acid ABC transporter permease [Rhizobacter sp.]|nr:branched-chain amino acid ABC transporter permease [Rhizobacter sp.]
MLAIVIGFAYQFADTFAFLILSSIGLAVIFGMMGVINLAHGEFIMCGAYVTVLTARAGLPLVLAMLLGAAAAGAIGMVIEYFVIRRLYGRLFDSIVATWAVSMIATQGMLIVAGPSIEGLKTPFGSFELAGLSFSWYRVLLPVVALGILLGLYLLFVKTPFGVRARATIQKPDMARALGVDTGRVYAQTFGLGAALAGLTGALYAPTMTTVPTMGSAFIVQSFVTVVVGGADVLLGAAPAAMVLAFIQSLLTASYGQLMGQVGLLLTVILVVRLLPKGVSGWMTRGAE